MILFNVIKKNAFPPMYLFYLFQWKSPDRKEQLPGRHNSQLLSQKVVASLFIQAKSTVRRSHKMRSTCE